MRVQIRHVFLMSLIKVSNILLAYIILSNFIYFIFFHLGENLFSCSKCKNEFKSYQELEEHLTTHQLKSKSTNLHLTCGNYMTTCFIFSYLSFKYPKKLLFPLIFDVWIYQPLSNVKKVVNKFMLSVSLFLKRVIQLLKI